MEIIRQTQPKRVQGSETQRLFEGKWRGNYGPKVDTQRVNWPGLIGVQKACGMYDPKPRLVKRVGS